MQVRFDPFSDMENVWIYSLDNQYLGQGTLYNRDKGTEPLKFQQKGKPQNNYILIVTALGEVPNLTKERVFLQIMEKAQSNNITVVLVVDEAHLWDTKAIVDLRLLVSSALDAKPPLKIVLSGQNNLLFLVNF